MLPRSAGGDSDRITVRVPLTRLTEITHAGRRATVRRGDAHPEQYLYIDCDGKTFFLGVLEPGMTRGDVKRMAVEWMDRRAKRGA